LRKKLLASRQVVQLDFQRKRIFFICDTLEPEKHCATWAATIKGAREARD
jgi:hypothetical protein